MTNETRPLVSVTGPDDLDIAEAKLRDALEELERLRAKSERLLRACEKAASMFGDLVVAMEVNGFHRTAQMCATAEQLARDAAEAP